MSPVYYFSVVLCYEKWEMLRTIFISYKADIAGFNSYFYFNGRLSATRSCCISWTLWNVCVACSMLKEIFLCIFRRKSVTGVLGGALGSSEDLFRCTSNGSASDSLVSPVSPSARVRVNPVVLTWGVCLGACDCNRRSLVALSMGFKRPIKIQASTFRPG